MVREGDSKELANWLFNLEQYCLVCGVTDVTEQVKVAMTFLAGRELTWWRAVACESWAMLGVCSWLDFSAHITTEFQDIHHQPQELDQVIGFKVTRVCGEVQQRI